MSAAALYWPAAVGVILILGVCLAACSPVLGVWHMLDLILLAFFAGMVQSFCAALVFARFEAARRPVPTLVNFFPVLAIVVGVLVLVQVPMH